jgi:hypothetical protein
VKGDVPTKNQRRKNLRSLKGSEGDLREGMEKALGYVTTLSTEVNH